MHIISQYNNGNSNVVLYSDGSKVRTIINSDIKPIHPESIDLKITDYCDRNCSYCHEKSTINGKHADLAFIINKLSPLPEGVEIAIGGGNPFSHPNLIPFLERIKEQGLIANITINQFHFRNYLNTISLLLKNNLVNGIGVSLDKYASEKDIKNISTLSDNVVFHIIIGVHDIDILSMTGIGKTLILGYKEYGRGRSYLYSSNKISSYRERWVWGIRKYLGGQHLSFDNLAIEQLVLRRFFTDDKWDKFYMGDDGEYTMYIDGVKKHYAKSSVSDKRVSMKEVSLLDYFEII